MKMNIKILKIFVLLLAIFILSLPLASSFLEPLSATWINRTDPKCEEVKGIASKDSALRIKLPEYTSQRSSCEKSIRIELNVEDNPYCSNQYQIRYDIEEEYDWPNKICTIPLKTFYCCEVESSGCSRRGEMVNKNWEIKIGYDGIDSPYTWNASFKFLNQEDIKKECNEYTKEKRNIWRIALLILFFIFAIISAIKRIVWLSVISIIITFLIGLLEFSGIFK